MRLTTKLSRAVRLSLVKLPFSANYGGAGAETRQTLLHRPRRLHARPEELCVRVTGVGSEDAVSDLALQTLVSIRLEIGDGGGFEVSEACISALKGLIELICGNLDSVIQSLPQVKDFCDPNNLGACNMTSDKVAITAACALGQLEAHMGNFSDAEEILSAALKKMEEHFRLVPSYEQALMDVRKQIEREWSAFRYVKKKQRPKHSPKKTLANNLERCHHITVLSLC
ncbi:Tetratricopeptide repeat (TPR)-like superfamily protein [Striga hermonthica]|uniref:Tetratricopeptide repeat (TPR)-like superfamily protein n=1 Tax=Striga hermonthica TaxID=68872 RepID=A0A9N7NL47_STRHE|nr:Tetratricopeptide repeat (TPR)-like superfamily protein [Striga hermonthica]